MISVLLTAKQTAMLEELFDLAEFDSQSDTPGMITGQFFKSAEGEGYFMAEYIDNEKSRALLGSLGLPLVEAPMQAEVYTDIE